MIGVRTKYRRHEISRMIAGLANGGDRFQRAAAAALNEHIVLQERQGTRMVAAQTGWPVGLIQQGSSIRKASPGPHMEAVVRFKGGSAPAGENTSRSWDSSMPGAKHGDWPSYSRKGGLLQHTFAVPAYGGRIYVRLGAARGPLGRVDMVVPPNELSREDMPAYPAAERLAGSDLERRVMQRASSGFGF